MIPTVNSLYSSILADLESELSISIPLVGKIFLRALAGVQAAKMYLIYLRIAMVQKNIFIDTADSESSGGTLQRFGNVWLGRAPLSATNSVFICSFIGSGTINVGLTLKSDDNSLNQGQMYVVTSVGASTINITSLKTGIVTNLSVGDTLTFTAPIANINDQVTITALTTVATDSEDLEEYRRLAIQKVRVETQGGSKGDYIIWASDVSGVRTVYPYVIDTDIGKLDLYVESNTADGLPTNIMLGQVEKAIEYSSDTTLTNAERSRRPMSVFEINYLPIVQDDIDVEITDLQDATLAVQIAIQNSIEDLLQTVRPFIDGVDNVNDRNDTLYVSDIITAIRSAIATDNNFTNATFTYNSASVTSVKFTDGDIPVLNTITYV